MRPTCPCALRHPLQVTKYHRLRYQRTVAPPRRRFGAHDGHASVVGYLNESSPAAE